MPLYALSRAKFAFLELPRPISASVGPFKANLRCFGKKTHPFQSKLHLHSFKELKSQILDLRKKHFWKKNRDP